MIRWHTALRASISIAVLMALAALSGCVTIRYQRPGRPITPRQGEALVFGRLRFFDNEREFFPWNVDLVSTLVDRGTERHVWLLRLDQRAVSAEVHPDPDGSLAIWLEGGDYALVGSLEVPTSGPVTQEVVALFRVPEGPVASYAGDLIMKTERREGLHAWSSEFGVKSVGLLPIATARATLEQRFGRLPEAPVASPWCTGDHLPGFSDSDLAARAKVLLDRGCDDVR